MPVTIEDVLGLLPELFPGIQQVPLANISQLPDNPGGTPSEEVILGLMESIRENDLQNPLKLKPNRTQPLAEGVQIHPENPRITLEGRPWRVEDFHYWVFSGNRRLIALNRLQKDKAPCYITNPSELETVVKGRIDNVVDQRGWWVDYQDVERVIKANPYVTQRQIKGYLGIELDRVNRALKLLPLLNPKTREAIVRDPNILNKGIQGISELAVSQLAALGPGTGLKAGRPKKDLAEGGEPQKLYPYPLIPPETQDQVYRALQVAIDEQMTESQVKDYVAWIKAGNRPEEYTSQKVAENIKAMKVQNKAHPSAYPEGPTPTPRTSPKVEGVKPSEPLTGETAPTDTPETVHLESKNDPGESRTDTPMVSAQTGHGRRLESDDQSVFWGTMAGIPWIKAIRAKIKAGQDLALWEKLFLVAAFFGRILHWTWHTTWPPAKKSIGWVGRHLKKALNGTLRFLGEVVGKPAKKITQGVVGIALVVGLAYGLYLFFFHPAGLRGLLSRTASGVIHWVGSWVNPWESDSKAVPQPLPTTIPTPGTSNPTQRHEDTKEGTNVGFSETQNPTTSTTHISPKASLPSVPRSQTEEQGLSAPIPEKGIGALAANRRLPTKSAPSATDNRPSTNPSGQSQLDLLNQINAESKTAQAFAQAFYTADYNDLLGRRTKLNKYLSPGYSSAFFKAFPIALKIKEIGEHKLVESFKPSGDAKLLRSDDQSEEFQVEGTLVTRSEMDITDPVTTQKPAGLVIDLSREPESKGLVTGVREMVFPGKKGSP